MAEVNLVIAGRHYRMACDDGEEVRLGDLAARLDAKVAEVRGQFGEIGDGRILMIAALTMVDHLSDAERRIAILEADLEKARRPDAAAEAIGASVAETIESLAARIERLAIGLDAGRRDGEPGQ